MCTAERGPIRYSGDVSTRSWLEPPPARLAPRSEEAWIQVASRIYAVDAAALPEGGFASGTVDSAECDRAFDALVEAGRAQCVREPLLSCRAGREARVEIAEQKAFVEGFDLVGEEGAFAADPRVGTASEGLVLTVRPAVPPDAGALQVDVRLRTVELKLPIATTDFRLSRRVPGGFTIQLPSFLNQELATTARLDEDRTLVLGSLSTLRTGRHLVALVRARRAPSERAHP
jgi:hypothetical protein